MKKLLLFVGILSISLPVLAQKNMPVALHYVTVKSSDADKLIALEKKYFSKVHKANIDAGKKMAGICCAMKVLLTLNL
tara:strand:+ start:2093 stop:2326 length:234 start_codon:yes stop_codon:yes gene_type:complete